MPVTFAELDRQKSPHIFSQKGEEGEALAKWYQSISATPIDKLSIKDIAQASRERIHLNETVPVALELLEDSMFEGDLYNAELLTALLDISADFWLKHDSVLQIMKLLMQNNKDALPPDQVKAAREFLRKVSP